MNDLRASLLSAKSTLDGLDAYLGGSGVSLHFPKEPQTLWIKHWKEKLSGRAVIDNIIEDIDRRGDAYEALSAFPLHRPDDKDSITPPEQVAYGRFSLKTETARYVFVTAYLSLSWSVYDSLYDLFTRLCGSSKVTANKCPSQNKKVAELFEGEKGQAYCGHDALFREKYYWIYRVSYVLRNAFVHEGGRFLGEPLLQESLSSKYFRLSNVALDAIEKWIDENLIWQRSCLIGDPNLKHESRSIPQTILPTRKDVFPWYNQDIRTLLSKYNSYLDDMFSHMIVWSVNSLIAQIEAMLCISVEIEHAKVKEFKDEKTTRESTPCSDFVFAKFHVGKRHNEGVGRLC